MPTVLCFHLPCFLQAVADHIPQLVQGVRGSQAQAEDLSAQLALIISSQNFLQVTGAFTLVTPRVPHGGNGCPLSSGRRITQFHSHREVSAVSRPWKAFPLNFHFQ